MVNVGLTRAHTNIALIKYWGKKNEELFLPMNSSLSLTLDAFYTDTKVEINDQLSTDQFWLNGQLADEKETKKITAFLDLFRELAGTQANMIVTSYNHVPTAAGLASSASAFAALAGALNQALDLNLAPDVLSTYARRGSGSSTRSIYGGFVEWTMGTNSEDSRALEIDDASWDIGMVIVAINTQQKELSSREGMKQTMATSPFYPSWVESAKIDLVAIKKAIAEKDFKTLGEITEANGMKMHATMLGANPPISYWEPDSIRVIKKVKELRKAGILCYVTMDAGPNVKILCRASETQQIQEALLDEFRLDQVIISGVGPGITPLSIEQWVQEYTE